MEIEELQDFVDWELKRKGGSVGEGGSGDVFAETVIGVCVLARKQGIDIVDAIALKIEEMRRK